MARVLRGGTGLGRHQAAERSVAVAAQHHRPDRHRARCTTAEAEQDDEWADRRYFSAESMHQLTQPLVSTSEEELLAAIA